MKLIIEHGQIKREIQGAFNLCGSPDDLRLIANQLLAHVNGEHGYGWVRILPCAPQPSIPNTAPEPWDTTPSIRRPRHCEGCDRPAVCDIIKPGTAPCGLNSGRPSQQEASLIETNPEYLANLLSQEDQGKIDG